MAVDRFTKRINSKIYKIYNFIDVQLLFIFFIKPDQNAIDVKITYSHSEITWWMHNQRHCIACSKLTNRGLRRRLGHELRD